MAVAQPKNIKLTDVDLLLLVRVMRLWELLIGHKADAYIAAPEIFVNASKQSYAGSVKRGLFSPAAGNLNKMMLSSAGNVIVTRWKACGLDAGAMLTPAGKLRQFVEHDGAARVTKALLRELATPPVGFWNPLGESASTGGDMVFTCNDAREFVGICLRETATALAPASLHGVAASHDDVNTLRVAFLNCLLNAATLVRTKAISPGKKFAAVGYPNVTLHSPEYTSEHYNTGEGAVVHANHHPKLEVGWKFERWDAADDDECGTLLFVLCWDSPATGKDDKAFWLADAEVKTVKKCVRLKAIVDEAHALIANLPKAKDTFLDGTTMADYWDADEGKPVHKPFVHECDACALETYAAACEHCGVYVCPECVEGGATCCDAMEASTAAIKYCASCGSIGDDSDLMACDECDLLFCEDCCVEEPLYNCTRHNAAGGAVCAQPDAGVNEDNKADIVDNNAKSEPLPTPKYAHCPACSRKRLHMKAVHGLAQPICYLCAQLCVVSDDECDECGCSEQVLLSHAEGGTTQDLCLTCYNARVTSLPSDTLAGCTFADPLGFLAHGGHLAAKMHKADTLGDLIMATAFYVFKCVRAAADAFPDKSRADEFIAELRSNVNTSMAAFVTSGNAQATQMMWLKEGGDADFYAPPAKGVKSRTFAWSAFIGPGNSLVVSITHDVTNKVFTAPLAACMLDKPVAQSQLADAYKACLQAYDDFAVKDEPILKENDGHDDYPPASRVTVGGTCPHTEMPSRACSCGHCAGMSTPPTPGSYASPLPSTCTAVVAAGGGVPILWPDSFEEAVGVGLYASFQEAIGDDNRWAVHALRRMLVILLKHVIAHHHEFPTGQAEQHVGSAVLLDGGKVAAWKHLRKTDAGHVVIGLHVGKDGEAQRNFAAKIQIDVDELDGFEIANGSVLAKACALVSYFEHGPVAADDDGDVAFRWADDPRTIYGDDSPLDFWNPFGFRDFKDAPPRCTHMGKGAEDRLDNVVAYLFRRAARLASVESATPQATSVRYMREALLDCVGALLIGTGAGGKAPVYKKVWALKAGFQVTITGRVAKGDYCVITVSRPDIYDDNDVYFSTNCFADREHAAKLLDQASTVNMNLKRPASGLATRRCVRLLPRRCHTAEALVRAYRCGELDPSTHPLRVDADHTRLYVHDVERNFRIYEGTRAAVLDALLEFCDIPTPVA